MVKFSVFRLFPAAFLALTLAAPSWAQGELTVEAGKPWTHAHSGITVPATLGGNALTKVRAYAQDELDVSLSFEPDGAQDFIAFYIFRNTNGAAPVWFAQAQSAIEARKTFGTLTLVDPPHSFALPGQTVTSGLRAIYAPQDGAPFTSTGVALVPVGNWYVKVRASSQRRSPAELGVLIDSVIAQIQWPAQAAPALPALPVIPCAVPLTFDKKSKDVRSDGLNDILGAALMSAVAGDDSIKKESPTVPIQWCRDHRINDGIASYRQGDTKNGYLLALGDNGNGMWVGLSPMNAVMAVIARKKAKPDYGLTLHTAAQDINFIAQDRLPSPERAIEILDANQRGSTVTTWGKDRQVEINSGSE
jgi:hypothetical protein